MTNFWCAHGLVVYNGCFVGYFNGKKKIFSIFAPFFQVIVVENAGNFFG
jgi:hypothetical protein